MTKRIWPGLAGIALAAGLMAPAPLRGDQAKLVSVAVADFDYADTSGEARDQRAEHAERLRAFVRSIRNDLSRSGKYQVVDIKCQPCSAGQMQPAELVEEARRAGARLLLYGGVHKMSTLVQYAKVQMVDVEADKLIFDRLVTFRGDTDDAWMRAEQFLARELSESSPR
jgi:hypothetical protein